MKNGILNGWKLHFLNSTIVLPLNFLLKSRNPCNNYISAF